MQEKIIDGGFKLGYNVATRKLEKLSSWSVADPVTTVLTAIESAVSLAVTVMSSEAFIADEPYLMAPDENPMLGAGGYKGMQGVTGMDTQHK